MNTTACPSDEQLKAFQVGDLPEPELVELAAHLERCAGCEHRARKFDTQVDSMLAAIRDTELVSVPVPVQPAAAVATPPAKKPNYLPVVLAAVLGIPVAVVVAKVFPEFFDAQSAERSTEPEDARVYLSAWMPIRHSASWPLPSGPDGKTIPNPFRTIRVQGKDSPHGIGMHPSGVPSSVTYALDGRFRTFHAAVSVNFTVPQGSYAPLTFRLFVDGEEKWKSPKPVKTQEDTQEVTVSVQGAKELTLAVAADGIARGAHAVWIEPYLTR